MFMEHEQSKSLLYMAAIKMSSADDTEKKRSISALKVQVGKSGRFEDRTLSSSTEEWV